MTIKSGNIYYKENVYMDVIESSFQNEDELLQYLSKFINYPIYKNHFFVNGQQVFEDFDYILRKEYWGNGYFIPEEHFSGDKLTRESRTIISPRLGTHLFDGYISILNELPEEGRLVYILRKDGIIYIGHRKTMPLILNKDASRDCYWWGNPKGKFIVDRHNEVHMHHNFADITVAGWKPLIQ